MPLPTLTVATILSLFTCSALFAQAKPGEATRNAAREAAKARAQAAQAAAKAAAERAKPAPAERPQPVAPERPQPAPAERDAKGDQYAGQWQHKGRVRIDLTITRTGDEWSADFNYFDLEGKLLGKAHGENFKLQGEKSLSFKLLFDVRPEATWKDSSNFASVDAKGNLTLVALGGLGPNKTVFERVGDAPAAEDKGPASTDDDVRTLITLDVKPKPGDVASSVHFQATVSPRGDLWALYRRQGEVELRSLPDDKLVHKLTIKGYITYLQFSEDGKTLAAGSVGGEDRQLGDPRPSPSETAFFTTADGERQGVVDHAGISVIPQKASLSHDAKYFAYTARQLTTTKAKLHVWQVSPPKLVLDYDDEELDKACVAFSADGKKLAYVGRTILTVDIGPGTRREIEYPKLSLNRLAISPDGKLLALAGNGGEIALINTSTGKLAHQFRAYEHSAGSMTFTAGGKILLTSGGNEQGIRAYDAQGKVVSKISVPKDTHPTSLSASSDGRYVLAQVYGLSQHIFIWETSWMKQGTDAPPKAERRK